MSRQCTTRFTQNGTRGMFVVFASQEIRQKQMPLSSLHAIELQLLMHALPGVDILRFARCSRTIHTAARSAFAFKYAQLEMHAGEGVMKIAAPVSAPSLLRRLLSAVAAPFRFAPAIAVSPSPPPSVPGYLVPFVVLVWIPERPHLHALADSEVDALLSAADRLRSVHELHLSGLAWSVSQSQWDRVFTCPSLVNLRVLRMCRQFLWRPPAPSVPRLVSLQPRFELLLARVCTLPHLHTLLGLSDWIKLNLLEHLCAAPSLTRLSLLHSGEPSGRQPAVHLYEKLARCRKLLQLDLMCPAFLMPVFRPFLESTVGRQLQCLTLREMRCIPFRRRTHSKSTALYRGHFEALVSLTRLELIQTSNVDIVLPFVTYAPKLERLIVESNAEQLTTCPSALVVNNLLAAAPALHLTLRLAPEHRASLADVRSNCVVIEPANSASAWG